MASADPGQENVGEPSAAPSAAPAEPGAPAGMSPDDPTAQPSAAISAGPQSQWNVAEWRGKTLLDRDGEKLGKLEDVYVDVETDAPQFATVKEGVFHRHLTFVPLASVRVTPDALQVGVAKDQVKDAPNIDLDGDELSQADESALYHHYEMNYTAPETPSGRRLARR